MTLYLPIGVPACGKSSLAEWMLTVGKLDKEAIVSPDAYRKILTGVRADQSANSYAFGICKYILGCRMQRGLDCYYDATNLVGAWRADAVWYAFMYEHDIVTILFTANDQECSARNTGRADQVPKEIMQRMFDLRHDLRVTDLPGRVVTENDLRKELLA